MPFTASRHGVRVALKVTPKAARAGVGGIVTDTGGRRWLAVRIGAAAQAGKANDAVIRLLAKRWRLAAGRLHIVAGAGARHKMLMIDGPAAELLSRLRRLEGAEQRAEPALGEDGRR